MLKKKSAGHKAIRDRYYQKNRSRLSATTNANKELKRAGYRELVNTGLFGHIRLKQTVVMVIPNKFAGTKAMKFVVYGVDTTEVLGKIRKALMPFGTPGADLQSIGNLNGLAQKRRIRPAH